MTTATASLELLSGLDAEQRAAAEEVRGPVCILAGAGTGKTRAITHRIAYAVATGNVPASQLLAVTFTARAAGEMRGRLRSLGVPGVQARTFHSAALRQLTYFWPRVVGGPQPTLIETKIRVVGEAAARCRLSLGRSELRDAAGEIEWAKARLTSAAQYLQAVAETGRQPSLPAADLARLYAAYEDAKRSRGLLDFEDVLMLAAAAVEEHPDVAAEIRGRYRHFVVDEYQDVNPLQQRLLDAWLGDRTDLCVVGDPNQTIYSFTGASSSYLLQFRRRFPDASVVRLVRDYRSTPQVVGLANAVLARAQPPAAAMELVAQRPAGPPPVFAEHDDETSEAAWIAARCAELIAGGVPPREIAVLYRVNAQSEAYESALAEAGIAYLVRGGERFFERPEIRQAVQLLRAAVRSAAEPAGDLEQAVIAVLSGTGWSPEPPPRSGAVRERWEAIAALVRLAGELAAADPTASLETFTAELEERSAAQHAPAVEGVTLASLHAAKGLEWDAVFLAGLVDGTMPIVHASTPEQIEEERRLLYVGVTRARERLFLSWALARNPGGRRTRSASRFLSGLLPGSSRAARPAPKPAARQRTGPVLCRVCGRSVSTAVERKLGRCADCPVDVDEQLFAELREWRLQQAKAQAQPAFCVFTDATLTAIAEARPSGVAELVRIPGVGQRKLDRYGEDVLAIVAKAATR